MKKQMIYINKNTVPHCYVEEKRFEWGEPYINIKPIFNLSINPELSDIEFTIEVLGKNNFKNNLMKLYNILLNREEYYRIENFVDPIINREFLIEKISRFIEDNINNVAPWINSDNICNEDIYLEMIQDDLKRGLLYERDVF